MKTKEPVKSLVESLVERSISPLEKSESIVEILQLGQGLDNKECPQPSSSSDDLLADLMGNMSFYEIFAVLGNDLDTKTIIDSPGSSLVATTLPESTPGLEPILEPATPITDSSFFDVGDLDFNSLDERDVQIAMALLQGLGEGSAGTGVGADVEQNAIVEQSAHAEQSANIEVERGEVEPRAENRDPTPQVAHFVLKVVLFVNPNTLYDQKP